MKTANHIVHVRKAIVHAKAIVVFSGFDILKMCYAADTANGVACAGISETGKEDDDMKKRFLSALLVIALITALLPITAAAANSLTALTVKGGTVDVNTTVDNSATEKWAYDDGELTLYNGFTGAIEATGDLNIVLDDDVDVTYIKVSTGSLTIDGNGNWLKVVGYNGELKPIGVWGDLTLNSANIDFVIPESNTYISNGIGFSSLAYCSGLLTINNSQILLDTSPEEDDTAVETKAYTAVVQAGGGIVMDESDIIIDDTAGELSGISNDNGKAYVLTGGDITMTGGSSIYIDHTCNGRSLEANELNLGSGGTNYITVNETTTLDGIAVKCNGGELAGSSYIEVETSRSQAFNILGNMTLNENSWIKATTDKNNNYVAALTISSATLTMNDESQLQAEYAGTNNQAAAVKFIGSGKIDFNSGEISVDGGSGNAFADSSSAIAPADVGNYIVLPDGVSADTNTNGEYSITYAAPSSGSSSGGSEISLEGPYMYDEDINVMMTEEEAGEAFEYGDSVYYLINDDTYPCGGCYLEDKECVEDMKLKSEFIMGGELIEDVRIVKKYIDGFVEKEDGSNYQCGGNLCDVDWFYFLEIVTKKDVKSFSEGDVQGVIEFNRKANSKKSIAKIKDSEVDVDFTLFYANDFTGANKIIDDKADIIWGETYALKFDNDEEIELSFGSANGGNNEGSFTVDVSGQGKVLLSYDTDPYEDIADANEGVKMNFIRFNNACFNRTGEFVYEMEDGVAAYRIVDGKLIEIPDCYDKGEGAFVFTTRILEEYVFANAKLNMPA